MLCPLGQHFLAQRTCVECNDRPEQFKSCGGVGLLAFWVSDAAFSPDCRALQRSGDVGVQQYEGSGTATLQGEEDPRSSRGEAAGF